MLESQEKFSHACKVKTYTLPTAHYGKKNYVDFYQYDPITQKMRRKKYHFDRVKKKTEQKAMGRELCSRITAQLRTGWNVWLGDMTQREYTPYKTAAEQYIKHCSGLLRKGVIKKTTHDRYMANLKIFHEWLENRAKTAPAVFYVYQFNKALIIDFLDHIFLDKDCSATTRNNYLSWLSVFAAWLRDKKYLSELPTDGIKKMREAEKKREPLSERQLKELRAHLSKEDKRFLLACMMLYFTMIRPEEMTSIRIGDINVKEQYVFISAEHSKNRRDARVALNKKLLRLMIELGVFAHPSDAYLFGTKEFLPSPKRQQGRIFRDRWAKVRKALGWADCYQFYSLKDSGIRDLANAEGIVTARNQARHSDVSITNIYLKHQDLQVEEGCKDFEGSL